MIYLLFSNCPQFAPFYFSLKEFYYGKYFESFIEPIFNFESYLNNPALGIKPHILNNL